LSVWFVERDRQALTALQAERAPGPGRAAAGRGPLAFEATAEEAGRAAAKPGASADAAGAERLDHVGSPEALQALRALAKHEPSPWLAQRAGAAADRLSRRLAKKP
jgi:hypothetical protein